MARFLSVSLLNQMDMEMSNYQNQIKELLAEIKEIVNAKGIDLNVAMEESGVSKENVGQILSGDKQPTLDEFLALCEISGITFSMPSVETPKNPM
jgi:DNA-binding phage protein